MKITSFVYCEKSVGDDLGRCLVVNPVQMFMVPKFPATLDYCIAIGLFDVKKKGETVMTIRLVDEDNNTIKFDTLRLNEVPAEQGRTRNPISAHLAVDLRGIEIPHSGTYTTIVCADGDELGRYSIDVRDNEDDKEIVVTLN